MSVMKYGSGSSFTLNTHELPQFQRSSSHPRELVDETAYVRFAHEDRSTIDSCISGSRTLDSLRGSSQTQSSGQSWSKRLCQRERCSERSRSLPP